MLLYDIILNHIKSYHIILYYIIFYHIILYYIILYHIILYYIILYYIWFLFFSWSFGILFTAVSSEPSCRTEHNDTQNQDKKILMKYTLPETKKLPLNMAEAQQEGLPSKHPRSFWSHLPSFIQFSTRCCFTLYIEQKLSPQWIRQVPETSNNHFLSVYVWSSPIISHGQNLVHHPIDSQQSCGVSWEPGNRWDR